jgi:hypothetical protein
MKDTLPQEETGSIRTEVWETQPEVLFTTTIG